MKIKEGFIIKKLGIGYIVVTVGGASKDFNGVIRLNESGAFLKLDYEDETLMDDISVQSGIDGLKSLKRGRKKKMKKPSKNKNKSELEQLREENEYLKAEIEYLKKLRALIQKEKKDQTPNKK